MSFLSREESSAIRIGTSEFSLEPSASISVTFSPVSGLISVIIFSKSKIIIIFPSIPSQMTSPKASSDEPSLIYTPRPRPRPRPLHRGGPLFRFRHREALIFTGGRCWKIGVIGHSAGANILPYCLYYDTRVKAAVANCGIFEVNSYYAYNRHGTIPASMALPGSVKYGVDTHDYIAAVAPRALFISDGAHQWGDGGQIRRMKNSLKTWLSSKNLIYKTAVLILKQSCLRKTEVGTVSLRFLRSRLTNGLILIWSKQILELH